MKQLIILTGPIASGKTHIANAIMMQHDSKSIISLFTPNNVSMIIGNESLIVIDSVEGREIEPLYEKLSKLAPNANIVFTTTDRISAPLYNSAYVIECKNSL